MEWFRHDTNAHDDIKIKKLIRMHGAAAYGAYWYLVECIYANGGLISEEDARDEIYLMGITDEDDLQNLMDSFLELDLFHKREDGSWGSHRINSELMNADVTHEKRVNAGRKGGISAQAKLKQCSSNAQANSSKVEHTTLHNTTGINNIALSNDKAHSPSGEGEPPKTAKNPVNYEEIVTLYNRICVGFPRITKLSDRRRKAIRARINGGYSLKDFETVFTKAQASDFLKGANDRNWSADFDWIISDGNMAKILDGNYDNGKARLKGKNYAPGIVADGSDPNRYKNMKTFKELAEEEKRARLGI